jgi:hypothetical protein
MKMKLFLIIIFSVFFVQGCEAQSQLPKEMPENIDISFNESGGMSRSYKRIKIENGVLQFEELTGNQQNPQKWSAKVSRENLEKLYKVFVENRFDAIKNDERKEMVYDAGSETISISVSVTKSFQVTYGKNSPLSGSNLRRYQAVSKAIEDFIVRHQNQSDDNSSNENQTKIEPEKYIQGKWRAAGETDRHTWFLEWTFDNGSFKQSGYPPITQDGKYKVVNVADNKITLELYDQKGTFGEEKSKVEILINPETKQLTISGMKEFSRVNTEQNN